MSSENANLATCNSKANTARYVLVLCRLLKYHQPINDTFKKCQSQGALVAQMVERVPHVQRLCPVVFRCMSFPHFPPFPVEFISCPVNKGTKNHFTC